MIVFNNGGQFLSGKIYCDRRLEWLRKDHSSWTVKKLPNSGFKVSVYKSAKGSLVAVFNSTGVEGLDIVLAAKAG